MKMKANHEPKWKILKKSEEEGKASEKGIGGTYIAFSSLVIGLEEEEERLSVDIFDLNL